MANSEMDYIHGYMADQTYNPTSMNAQSGIAVAEALNFYAIASSTGTKTYGQHLQDLQTAYSNLSSNQKRRAFLVRSITNGQVVYKITNTAAGLFSCILVTSDTEIDIQTMSITEAKMRIMKISTEQTPSITIIDNTSHSSSATLALYVPK